jgi:cytoskeletal protein RodZ
LNKIGELLKKERIRQGLEIKDIENAISVRELYLRAIEEGNHKIVPGEVYLKGFIRNYAIQLGFDPQEVMKLYQKDKEPAGEDTAAGEALLQQTQPIPVMQKVEEQQLRSRKYQRRDKREEKKTSFLGGWGKLVLAVLILSGAVVGGVALNFFESPFSSAPSEEEYTQTETKTPARASNANVAPNSGQADNAIPVAKDVTVTIKYNGNCWTQVSVDDKPEYAGTPRAGETRTFSGNEKIVVKLGSAGAADVTHNGKALGSLGGPGSVVERTFTKDGAP